MPFPKVCITCAKPSENHLKLLWKKSAIESLCIYLLKALDIDSSILEGIKSKLYICDTCIRLTEHIKVVSEKCQANIASLLEYEECEKSRLEEMPIHSTCISPNESMKSRFQEQMPIHYAPPNKMAKCNFETPIRSASPNEMAKSRLKQAPIHSSSQNETAKSKLKQMPIHPSSPNETAKSKLKQMPIHPSSPNKTAKSKFKQPPIHSASPNETAKSRLKQMLNHSASSNGTGKIRIKQEDIHSAKKNSGFKRKETNISRNKNEKRKPSLKFLQKVPRLSTDQPVGIPLSEIRDADLDVEIRSWDHTYAARSVETDMGPGDDHIDYCSRDRIPIFTENSIPMS